VTNEDYLQTQHTVCLLMGLVESLPLAEFLDAINRAETLGPIVDPTLYRQASGTMHEIKTCAQALREAQQYYRKWKGKG
jgi:hypothetical protein